MLVNRVICFSLDLPTMVFSEGSLIKNLTVKIFSDQSCDL